MPVAPHDNIAPPRSRSTSITGCNSRCIISPRAAITADTESTRNGISGLTTASRIVRRPSLAVTVSIAILDESSARLPNAVLAKAAASVMASALKPSRSPGSIASPSAEAMEAIMAAFARALPITIPPAYPFLQPTPRLCATQLYCSTPCRMFQCQQMANQVNKPWLFCNAQPGNVSQLAI